MFSGKHLREIAFELKEHIPFTAFGAITGVIFMLLFRNISKPAGHTLFTIFHPTHVVLSAMVTAAMFRLHRKKTSIWIVLIVGYFGSVGIATLSDSIMPYFGEKVLGLHIPAHSELHHNESESHQTESHLSEIHLGFIEEWYLVNPAAFLGIFIAWFLPRTKLPHAAHILISTWASSSHILMTAQNQITLTIAMSMLLVLFLSVWLPCCVSDIVFPLLFTNEPRMENQHHHCCY